MKAIELLEKVFVLTEYHYEGETTDQIIIGNPHKEVNKVLVTWIADFSAVRHAAENGYDAIITHEPTFWIHINELSILDGLPEDSFMRQAGNIKRKYIEDNDLVILRVHDSWDFFPEYGIQDSWAKFLGLGKPVAAGSKGKQQRYDIEPVALDVLAQRIAQRTALLGEPVIQVIGDGKKIVSKVGLGAGYCSTVQVARSLGCDVSIVCDDGTLFWENLQCAKDMDYPVIRVNHGTCEEQGMRVLAEFLRDNIPEGEFIHLPHKPAYHLVGGLEG